MAADDLPKSDPLNFSPKLGESSSPLDLKSDWSSRIEALKQQEADLKRTIADLQGTARGLTTDQMGQLQADLKRLIAKGTVDLEQRQRTLQLEIEKLERRQERIQAEMRSTFAGTSQDLAMRLQGFKDYLVGSLQDLVTAAEQLNLAPQAPPPAPDRPATLPPPTGQAGPGQIGRAHV